MSGRDEGYTGDIATPIPPADISVSLLDDAAIRAAQIEAEQRRVAEERERRYHLLMEHHGVPSGQGLLSFALLAIELARTHVPGLRVEATAAAHRPRAWTSSRKAALVADMVELMAAGKTKAEAARLLVKRAAYQSLGGKSRSLENRFDEAKGEAWVTALAEIAKDLPAEHFIAAVRACTENE
ncbi:hypothetical protein MKI84_01825 [Ancylobacter sp. A5.8]|uniref:hypothetical protein n=1 Tax=Ancylobacter gelatini TaxID=2919920 RepID=UPI001F4EEEFD|nr:hypothetical protein [Ancylobacter gelatini]MCJ8141647.1 hypothetical protein [Ancylobacter gelatini]